MGAAGPINSSRLLVCGHRKALGGANTLLFVVHHKGERNPIRGAWIGLLLGLQVVDNERRPSPCNCARRHLTIIYLQSRMHGRLPQTQLLGRTLPAGASDREGKGKDGYRFWGHRSVERRGPFAARSDAECNPLLAPESLAYPDASAFF